jgi:hypothetical protein
VVDLKEPHDDSTGGGLIALLNKEIFLFPTKDPNLLIDIPWENVSQYMVKSVCDPASLAEPRSKSATLPSQKQLPATKKRGRAQFGKD